MNYQLLIQNRASTNTYNYASVCEKVTHTTNRTGSAGKLTMTFIKANEVQIDSGDPVQFMVDGTKVFAGYVFTRTINRWGEMDITAYDQLRYLKANESYLFTAASMSDIINRIANDFQLTVGTIEDTGYLIPSFVRENKSCLDIISQANEFNILNTGKVYVFFDDFGKLSYREAGSMMVTDVIGSKSLLTEFKYKADIDSDTYNRIKLVRPNEETGRTDVYIFEDSSTIATWGLLQYYAQVDEEMNEAQIREQGGTMLTYYNRELKTLTIESLGIAGLRAGMMVMLKIPELGNVSINQFILLDKATHTFQNKTHTMKLETRTLLV